MADQDVRVRATVLTHRGARRTGNEDAVVVASATFAGVSDARPHVITLPIREPVVVAVADGLGGHAAGEVASRAAVTRLAADSLTLTSKDAIVHLLQSTSAEIAAAGDKDPSVADMGTTVVGLVLTPEQTLWFNVGDSRLYSWAGGYLAQVSVDDTPAAAFAEPGESPPPTGIVTQVLGESPRTLRPHVGVEPALAEARYLLCSDGLSDLVALEEIEQVLQNTSDDDTAVKALWAAAMNAGGVDNITIVLVGPA